MSYELTDAVIASSVPAPERFTLLMLAHSTRPGTYRSWPSVQRLAVLTQCHVDTVRRQLRKLEADGYIKSEQRGGSSTVYTINVGHLGEAQYTPSPKEVEPVEDPPPGQYVDPFAQWDGPHSAPPADCGPPADSREVPPADSPTPPPANCSPHPPQPAGTPPANLTLTPRKLPLHPSADCGPEQVREQGKEQVREQGGLGGTLPLDTPKPTQPTTSKRRKPETSLPDDWQPTEDHRIYAARYQLDVDREAERFRNHAAMKDRRVRDWNAAFRNWLDKAREFAPAANAVKPGQEAWRRYCEQ